MANFKRYIEIVTEIAQDGCICLSHEDEEILKECSQLFYNQKKEGI